VGAVPHDWLLPQCAAVVHHGGAGTTAAGLSAACPTVVIYFFGMRAFVIEVALTCMLLYMQPTIRPVCIAVPSVVIILIDAACTDV
jgi:hypothetical protein